MEPDKHFDSMDLRKIFESLPDDKKREFLRELREVVEASDAYIADLETAFKETLEELQNE